MTETKRTLEEIAARLYRNRGPRGYPSDDEVASALREAHALGLAEGRAGPPPLCTGGGTIDAAFISMRSSQPSVGRCGVCQHRVPLMSDAQTIAPHGWRSPPPEDLGRACGAHDEGWGDFACTLPLGHSGDHEWRGRAVLRSAAAVDTEGR